MHITELIDALERAPRQGTVADSEKNGRYVVFSEAALDLIIRELRLAANERPDAEYFGGGYQPRASRCALRPDPPRGGSGVPSK